MTRIRIVGLCLVAMFAFSAYVASAAQAGQDGECVKAPKVEKKYTGHYTDKLCKVHATAGEEAEGKKNKYNWVSPAAATFTATSGVATLKGPAGTILCTASTTVGHWTGPTKNSEVATFTGCEFKGAVTGECHSAGQAAGTIVTNELETTLLDHGEKGPSGGEPAEGEIWDIFTAKGGSGVQAEYQCAGIVVIRTLGSLGGIFSAKSINKASTKGEILFKGEGSPEQDLFNEASIAGGPFEPAGPGFETLTGKIVNSKKMELRT